MSKENLCVLLLLCFVLLNSACQSGGQTNGNAALSANSNASANMPPGFGGTPSLMTNSAPGIPADPKTGTLNVSNSTTPIPGITDVNNNRQPSPKNTPPIPGIPSEAELKRQMNTKITNSKIMESKPPINESNSATGPMYRPRKNNKP